MEIAVLEVMCANRNALVPTETATVVPSNADTPHPELPAGSSYHSATGFVSIKIVNANDPEDVYYFNDPKPIDLLVADKVALTVDIATDSGTKITATSETFLVANMTGDAQPEAWTGEYTPEEQRHAEELHARDCHQEGLREAWGMTEEDN